MNKIKWEDGKEVEIDEDSIINEGYRTYQKTCWSCHEYFESDAPWNKRCPACKEIDAPYTKRVFNPNEKPF